MGGGWVKKGLDGALLTVNRGVWRDVREDEREEAENGHAATAVQRPEQFQDEAKLLAAQLEQLVYGERQHAEHQMSHDLADPGAHG